MSEVAGRIATSHGTEFNVFVLKASDLPYILDSGPAEMQLKMAARSIRVDVEDFKQWDLHDAMKVIKLQNQIMEAF